ncbi:hypothetical protein SAMN05660909_02618 [Chitinophaga terrae (ex Kim and Jung 2007)]|uniref:Tetratricopeptide repeat protein n=1 Tax=Chitinophaga terrae (ex Kim and Jung 2007) TaxID=408074 RepID=A0A1H4CGC5_9BACT|nr:hypothetical protein [Chitinophaga terrae (ex Kim and Jung 2007)]GEP88958.1 hypothetical protein CTE07_06030 [Chitinophaga terrae (ex Kim and Jung 2007)]SEA59363.1 hypothetical protein SAMN05660909_02618 [Chitinophaga terrae (ex Kim and Jung 2007)]
MEQELMLELDFAKLSLVGNRFDEAEEKYSSILKASPNNTVAWLGLGFSKYGLLLEGRTTLMEVFYCFEKAKLTTDDTELHLSIEEAVLNKSMEVVKNLLIEGKTLLKLNEEASSQMALNMAAGVVSAIAGGIAAGSNNKSSSLYGSLTALGGTAISYSGYSKAKRLKLTTEEQVESIKDTVKQIGERLEGFVTDKIGELESVKVMIENMKSITKPRIPAPQQIHSSDYVGDISDEERKWYNNQWNVVFWMFAFFPAGLYGISKSNHKGGIILKIFLVIVGLILLVIWAVWEEGS